MRIPGAGSPSESPDGRRAGAVGALAADKLAEEVLDSISSARRMKCPELMTRRRCLREGVMLTSVALVAPLARAFAVLKPEARFGGFPMGIQSYSLRHLELNAALDAVVELGLHHVELYGRHLSPQASDAEIARVLENLEQRDIAISAHGVNRFTHDHEANRELFEFAHRAGIRNLSADPDPDDETFDSLDRLVDEFGVRIAIHNHGPRHHWGTPERILEALEGRHPGVGVCADLGHFLRADIDPVAALESFRGRLFGVHLKDFSERREDADGVVVGRGHLDLEAVFSMLRAVEFPSDGALSLEYEEPDPMGAIRECLEAIAVAAQK